MVRISFSNQSTQQVTDRKDALKPSTIYRLIAAAAVCFVGIRTALGDHKSMEARSRQLCEDAFIAGCVGFSIFLVIAAASARRSSASFCAAETKPDALIKAQQEAAQDYVAVQRLWKTDREAALALAAAGGLDLTEEQQGASEVPFFEELLSTEAVVRKNAVRLFRRSNYNLAETYPKMRIRVIAASQEGELTNEQKARCYIPYLFASTIETLAQRIASVPDELLDHLKYPEGEEMPSLLGLCLQCDENDRTRLQPVIAELMKDFCLTRKEYSELCHRIGNALLHLSARCHRNDLGELAQLEFDRAKRDYEFYISFLDSEQRQSFFRSFGQLHPGALKRVF